MRIETKADIGNTVYFMENNKIQSADIHEISAKVFSDGTNLSKIKYKTKYQNGGMNSAWLLEEEVFLTKELLLENLLKA